MARIRCRCWPSLMTKIPIIFLMDFSLFIQSSRSSSVLRSLVSHNLFQETLPPSTKPISCSFCLLPSWWVIHHISLVAAFHSFRHPGPIKSLLLLVSRRTPCNAICLAWFAMKMKDLKKLSNCWWRYHFAVFLSDCFFFAGCLCNPFVCIALLIHCVFQRERHSPPADLFITVIRVRGAEGASLSCFITLIPPKHGLSLHYL